VDTAQGPLTVVAQGVQAGERVVVDGQNQLRAGAKVDPRAVPLPSTPVPQGEPGQQAVPASPQQAGSRSQPRQPQPQGRTAQQGGPREAVAQ
jgi:multidrug efflux system membrane fusion protein